MVKFITDLRMAWLMVRYGTTGQLEAFMDGFAWCAKGGNYSSADFKVNDGSDGVINMTIQRVNGKTPLYHMAQLTQQRDLALARLNSARRLLREAAAGRELPPLLLNKISEELNRV